MNLSNPSINRRDSLGALPEERRYQFYLTRAPGHQNVRQPL